MSSSPAAGAPRSLSATDAARDAVDVVKRRLFPFQFDRWFALGFVAFLDQCGRGGGGGNFHVPSGGGGSPGGGGGGEKPDLSGVGDWISSHIGIIVGITVLVLVLVVGLTALILWLNSRGVFMYLDNVATGRADVARPWREHKAKASSYFAWSFGVSLAALAGVLVLLVPMLWLAFALITGGAAGAAIAGLVLVVLAFLCFMLVLSLFAVLLRDFAAPLQMHLGIPCGQALGMAWGLVKGSAGTFVAYVALKIVFAIGAGIVAVMVGCCTCCLGFLPVLSQTILQPLLYFERAWSLCLLRQAGYDLFADPPAP